MNGSLVVRNNDTRSLSWTEFQLIQEAERQVEHQRLGLLPHEYYTGPFPISSSCQPCSVILCLVLVSILLASFPSVYATKYLLQLNTTAWDVIQVYPAYFTKVHYFFDIKYTRYHLIRTK